MTISYGAASSRGAAAVIGKTVLIADDDPAVVRELRYDASILDSGLRQPAMGFVRF